MLTNISDLNNEEFKEKIKPEIISIKKSNNKLVKKNQVTMK